MVRIIICLFFPFISFAQGLQFEHGTFAEALEKARQEKKPVFLDAYTVWCGPCKMLANKTFPDSTVAAFYNARFVNVKIDMERGEGPQLAKQYGVDLYPTLLYLDAEAKIMHRVSGFYGPAEFLALGQKALDPAQNLSALTGKYNSGDRSPALLKAYLEARAEAYDPGVGRIAAEYLKNLEDLGSPANMDLIVRYVDDPFDPAFAFLVEHQTLFNAAYTEDVVGAHIDEVFENYLQNHPTLQLGEVQRLYGAVYPGQGERLASAYRLSYYQKRSDHERLAQSAIDHYNRYPTDDPDELNEIAGMISRDQNDPATLQKALEWAKKSVGITETYYNQETLAGLYAKSGKKKAALKAAKRAVELAKAAGEEAPQAQALVDQYK